MNKNKHIRSKENSQSNEHYLDLKKKSNSTLENFDLQLKSCLNRDEHVNYFHNIGHRIN